MVGLPESPSYCGGADEERASGPGRNSYAFDRETYALCKPDGGLLAVWVERGIGCEVTLRETGGKLSAHVLARRVSVEPLALEKGKILLQEPKSKVDYWESDLDMSTADRVELSANEVPLRMRVVVGVIRSN